MCWVPTVLPVPPIFGLRSFETFTGTRVVVKEGCGKDGHEMAREVIYWLDEKGDLIARYDPADDMAGDTAGGPQDYGRDQPQR